MKFQITQKQFEAFFELMEKREIKSEKMNPAKYSGAVAQAAIDAKWVDPFVVEDADPAQVWSLYKAVEAYVSEVRQLPKA